MKKLLLAGFTLCLMQGWASAQSVALVYENEAKVQSNDAILGAITPEGIVISAKVVLASNATLLVGLPGAPLKKAVLLKLDAPSDVALIQPGEEVANPELQKIYQAKAQAFLTFLPNSNAAEPAAASSPVAIPVVPSSSAPYQIKINGELPGANPVTLPFRFRKSEMKFEIVRTSTIAVWNVELKITADPKLSFWKKGKNQTLSDIPTPTFNYGQQMMFRPLAQGKSIVLPIEIYFMEAGAYTLNVSVKSKSELFETKIPLLFKSKS